MKIGMTEIILVLIVALFVAGPDKLPYYAKKFGEALRSFRNATADATKEIQENVVEPLQEAEAPLREAMEPVNEMSKEINDDVNEIKKSFSDITKPVNSSASASKEEEAADKTIPGEPEESASEESAPAPEESVSEAPASDLDSGNPEKENTKEAV